MKRRTLLKSVLALPLVNRTVSAATPSTTSQTAAHASDALYSGLAGLDYAMGGLKSGEMSCFFGPPCMGKTMLLLELAARLVGRYGQNVYLHGVHQPSVYLSRKVSICGDTKIYFAEIRNFVDDWDQGDEGPGVVLLDAQSDPAPLALELVDQLARSHPGGCAALIMDGWCTCQARTMQRHSQQGVGSFRAERWPQRLISGDILADAFRVGAELKYPWSLA